MLFFLFCFFFFVFFFVVFFSHHNHICLSYVYSVRDGVCKNWYMYILFLSITFVSHMFVICKIMYERLVQVCFLFFFCFFFFLFFFLVVQGLNACPCEFLHMYISVVSEGLMED